jgi:hypothetical protein
VVLAPGDLAAEVFPESRVEPTGKEVGGQHGAVPQEQQEE